jgi:rubrerythrin
MYKMIHGSSAVLRLADGAVIPDDERNLDRVAYLEWLQSNTPEPADVSTQEELISSTRLKAKNLLLQLLPLLDSLHVDALTDGETVVWEGETTPLAEVIKQLKAGLRSVVEMDLSAYETSEEMEDAVQAAYFSLAMQAPAQVRSAFSALVPK